MPRQVYREKLFFSIYKNQNKEFQHLIVYRVSKKELREELEEQGFTIKGIFSQKDVEAILVDSFTDTTISDKTLSYLNANIEEWNRSR